MNNILWEANKINDQAKLERKKLNGYSSTNNSAKYSNYEINNEENNKAQYCSKVCRSQDIEGNVNNNGVCINPDISRGEF